MQSYTRFDITVYETVGSFVFGIVKEMHIKCWLVWTSISILIDSNLKPFEMTG